MIFLGRRWDSEQKALPGPDGLLGTPDDVLDPANSVLGGQATGGPSISAINSAVDAINRGFDKCRFLNSCTGTCD